MNLLADESIDKLIVDELRRNDKDFGELVFCQGLVHMGVVLVRLSGLSLPAKAESVSTVLANHEDELLEAFSVISPGRVRIRQGR